MTYIELFNHSNGFILIKPESEFNEYEPRLRSSKNRFQFSAGFNLETLNIIYLEQTIFESRLKFKPQIKLVRKRKSTLTSKGMYV